MSTDAQKIRLLMLLRRSGVSDARVLSAIERVPREAFVPTAFLDQAYENRTLPIGLSQTISQPLVVALMLQSLAVTDRHKVLEIGTGSGYQAAVLAKLCRRLYSIERHRPLLDQAVHRLDSLGIRNITTLWGDGLLGWPKQAPFDRIVISAAHRGAEPPRALTQQLAIGGVIVIPMGEEKHNQMVVRFRLTETGLEREDLWPVHFVPLLPKIADAQSA